MTNDNQIFYEVSRFLEGEYYIYLFASKPVTFNFSITSYIGEIDFDVLEKSFDTLIQKYDVFRTTLLLVGDEVKQRIWEHNPSLLKIEYLDLRNSKNKDRELNKLVKASNQVLFNFQIYPWIDVKLAQLSEIENVLLISMPHFIVDFDSMKFIRKELSQFYKSHLKNEIIKNSEVIHFKDYIAEINQVLASPKGDKHRAYWKRLLTELPTQNLTTTFSNMALNQNNSYKETILQEVKEYLIKLPSQMESNLLGVVSMLREIEGAAYTLYIDQKKFKIIKMLAEKLNIPLSVLIVSTFHLLVYKLSGENDVIIGIHLSLRDKEKFKDVIGYLINTIFVRYKIDDSLRLNEFFKFYYINFIRTSKHKIYPMEKALYDSDVPLHRAGKLFINITNNETTLNLSSTAARHSDSPTYSFFDIDCHISLFNNIAEICIHYKAGLFTKVAIEFIFSKYLEMIDELDMSSNKLLKDIKLEYSNRSEL